MLSVGIGPRYFKDLGDNIALIDVSRITGVLTLPALTEGSVLFIGPGGAVTEDNSNFFYDDTNKRIGIATSSPTQALTLANSGNISLRTNVDTDEQGILYQNTAGNYTWRLYRPADPSQSISKTYFLRPYS